jgi:hypothetical protein
VATLEAIAPAAVWNAWWRRLGLLSRSPDKRRRGWLLVWLASRALRDCPKNVTTGLPNAGGVSLAPAATAHAHRSHQILISIPDFQKLKSLGIG